MQGDITGLIDSVSGLLLAAYTYDACGMLVAHPINDNQFSVIGSVMLLMALPQAYRGYVFSFVGDELCYYLGSRFYSPRLGRFLNADKHFDTGTGVLGTNVYAYCNNNPVMYVDPTGELAQSNPALNMTQVLAYVSKMTKVVTKLKAMLRSLSDRIRYFKYVNIALDLIEQIHPMNGYNGPYIEVNSKTQTISVLYESRFRSLGKPSYIEMLFYYGTLSYWQQEIAGYLYSQIGPLAKINEFFSDNEVLGMAFSEVLYSYSAYVGVAWDAFDILCQYIKSSNAVHNCIINRIDKESENNRDFSGNELVVVFVAIYHIEWKFSKGQYVVVSTENICICNEF